MTINFHLLQFAPANHKNGTQQFSPQKNCKEASALYFLCTYIAFVMVEKRVKYPRKENEDKLRLLKTLPSISILCYSFLLANTFLLYKYTVFCAAKCKEML